MQRQNTWPPLHRVMATRTAIHYTGEWGQKPFRKPEPQESHRPWQCVPCYTEVLCRPVGSRVHCHVQQVAGAILWCFKTSTIVPIPRMPSVAHLTEYRPVACSDLYGHESVGVPGSQVPLDTSSTYARVLFFDFSSAFNMIIPQKLPDNPHGCWEVSMHVDSGLPPGQTPVSLN